MSKLLTRYLIFIQKNGLSKNQSFITEKYLLFLNFLIIKKIHGKMKIINFCHTYFLQNCEEKPYTICKKINF